jgi:hypothetical protein
LNALNEKYGFNAQLVLRDQQINPTKTVNDCDIKEGDHLYVTNP